MNVEIVLTVEEEEAFERPYTLSLSSSPLPQFSSPKLPSTTKNTISLPILEELLVAPSTTAPSQSVVPL